MNKLKELRERKKITQCELSQMTGISISYIAKIETNKRANISPAYKKTLAVALKSSVKDIFLHD